MSLFGADATLLATMGCYFDCFFILFVQMAVGLKLTVELGWLIGLAMLEKR
jgi:hypothetical protein